MLSLACRFFFVFVKNMFRKTPVQGKALDSLSNFNRRKSPSLSTLPVQISMDTCWRCLFAEKEFYECMMIEVASEDQTHDVY